MTTNVFTGCMPALMTPCTADRRPDYDALVATARELVAAGMSAVVYCGSMGDWPLLTDAQRMEGVARLAAAGVPVVVGTGAVDTREAVAHARHAAQVGALGLMVIPRVLSRGTSAAAQKAHFEAVLSARAESARGDSTTPYYGFATRVRTCSSPCARRIPNPRGCSRVRAGPPNLRYAAETITSQDDAVSLMRRAVDTARLPTVSSPAGRRAPSPESASPAPGGAALRWRCVRRRPRAMAEARNGQRASFDEAMHVPSSFARGPDLVSTTST